MLFITPVLLVQQCLVGNENFTNAIAYTDCEQLLLVENVILTQSSTVALSAHFYGANFKITCAKGDITGQPCAAFASVASSIRVANLTLIDCILTTNLDQVTVSTISVLSAAKNAQDKSTYLADTILNSTVSHIIFGEIISNPQVAKTSISSSKIFDITFVKMGIVDGNILAPVISSTNLANLKIYGDTVQVTQIHLLSSVFLNSSIDQLFVVINVQLTLTSHLYFVGMATDSQFKNSSIHISKVVGGAADAMTNFSFFNVVIFETQISSVTSFAFSIVEIDIASISSFSFVAQQAVRLEVVYCTFGINSFKSSAASSAFSGISHLLTTGTVSNNVFNFETVDVAGSFFAIANVINSSQLNNNDLVFGSVKSLVARFSLVCYNLSQSKVKNLVLNANSVVIDVTENDSNKFIQTSLIAVVVYSSHMSDISYLVTKFDAKYYITHNQTNNPVSFSLFVTAPQGQTSQFENINGEVKDTIIEMVAFPGEVYISSFNSVNSASITGKNIQISGIITLNSQWTGKRAIFVPATSQNSIVMENVVFNVKLTSQINVIALLVPLGETNNTNNKYTRFGLNLIFNPTEKLMLSLPTLVDSIDELIGGSLKNDIWISSDFIKGNYAGFSDIASTTFNKSTRAGDVFYLISALPDLTNLTGTSLTNPNQQISAGQIRVKFETFSLFSIPLYTVIDTALQITCQTVGSTAFCKPQQQTCVGSFVDKVCTIKTCRCTDCDSNQFCMIDQASYLDLDGWPSKLDSLCEGVVFTDKICVCYFGNAGAECNKDNGLNCQASFEFDLTQQLCIYNCQIATTDICNNFGSCVDSKCVCNRETFLNARGICVSHFGCVDQINGMCSGNGWICSVGFVPQISDTENQACSFYNCNNSDINLGCNGLATQICAIDQSCMCDTTKSIAINGTCVPLCNITADLQKQSFCFVVDSCKNDCFFGKCITTQEKVGSIYKISKVCSCNTLFDPQKNCKDCLLGFKLDSTQNSCVTSSCGQDNACNANGECMFSNSQFQCKCQNHSFGIDCNQIKCGWTQESGFCSNRGKCIESAGTFKCKCDGISMLSGGTCQSNKGAVAGIAIGVILAVIIIIIAIIIAVLVKRQREAESRAKRTINVRGIEYNLFNDQNDSEDVLPSTQILGQKDIKESDSQEETEEESSEEENTNPSMEESVQKLQLSQK